MQDIYLIAEFGGESVAIESKYVESVVHIPEIIPAPQADKSVAGLFALRSRVLTLIDSSYMVTGISSSKGRNSLAIILEISGHCYGLLVERAEDVVSISREDMVDSISASQQWQKIVKEFAVLDGKTIMIVDPETLIGDAERLAA